MGLFGPNANWKPNSEWCDLEDAPDSPLPTIFGYSGNYVYVIARPEGNGWKTAVRAGKTANLVERMDSYEDNQRIVGATYGEAVVKWSKIDPSYIDGVERYLIEELDPTLNEQIPEPDPREVSLPSRVARP